MQVIRIEHPSTGVGPYRHNRDCVPELLYGCDPDRHPTITTDMDGNELARIRYTFTAAHHRFGFLNKEQALRWFNQHERQAIAERGFVARVYDVPDAIVGRSQVVFDLRVAKLVGHIDPERFVSGDLNMLIAADQEHGADS